MGFYFEAMTWGLRVCDGKFFLDTSFPHLLCQFLPCCLYKIFPPLTFSCQLKTRGLRDASWRPCSAYVVPDLRGTGPVPAACAGHKDVEDTGQNLEIIKKWMWLMAPMLNTNTSKNACWGREHAVWISSVCSSLHLKAQDSGVRLFGNSHRRWQRSQRASATCQAACRNRRSIQLFEQCLCSALKLLSV